MTKIRPLLFALFGAALAISISGAEIAAGLLLLDWGLRSIRNRREHRWFSSPLDIPIAFFILWGAASAVLIGAVGPLRALSLESAFLLFFLAAHDVSEKNLGLMMRWFVVAVVFTGFLGGLQKLSGINFNPTLKVFQAPEFFSHWPRGLLRYLALRNQRAMGTRSHPLTYAETFIPAFFLLLAPFLNKGPIGKSKKICALAGIFFVLVGVLMAQGRAVWLALFAGVLVFAWVSRSKLSLKVVGFFFVAAVLFLFAAPGFRGRLMSSFSSSSGSLGDQQSKSIRFDLWKAALGSIREHPVAGVGLKEARLFAKDPTTGEEREWSETHNIFLQVAVESGFVGLGLFLWILFVAGRSALQLADPWRAVFTATIVAFLVAGLTESWTGDKEIAMIFWLMIGSLSSLQRKQL